MELSQMTTANAVALKLNPNLPLDGIAKDVAGIDAIVAKVEESLDFLRNEDWISAPLINRTGEETDHRLTPSGEEGKPTSYLELLPWTQQATQFLRSKDMIVEHARLLVLRPGGMFWPHRDNHQYFRLLMPLSSEPKQCLYFFEGEVFSAEIGQLYYFQPDACHAAFNFGETNRGVVCFDVTLTRNAVNFLLTQSQHLEPYKERFVFSSVVERQLKSLITSFAEADPKVASKFAIILGLCCFSTTVENTYSILYQGLSECDQSRMSDHNKAELQNLKEIILKHPYFPRSAALKE